MINSWLKLYTGFITAFELMLVFLQLSPHSVLSFIFYPRYLQHFQESRQSYVIILNHVKWHRSICFFFQHFLKCHQNGTLPSPAPASLPHQSPWQHRPVTCLPRPSTWSVMNGFTSPQLVQLESHPLPRSSNNELPVEKVALQTRALLTGINHLLLLPAALQKPAPSTGLS